MNSLGGGESLILLGKTTLDFTIIKYFHDNYLETNIYVDIKESSQD